MSPSNYMEINTQGVGYLSISDKNEPFRKWINFDKSFNRTEQGTDINIAGVYEIPELNKKLIVAILDSFLYAIYKQTLSIDVNGIIISKKSLGTIMRRYEDDIDQTTNEIHNLLVNKNTFVYQKNVVDKTNSDVEIRIILEDDSSRKISMIRNPWMKITNMDRFPRGYQFSGMIIIKGRELNELLRKAENPQHNDWEPDRIDNNIQLKNRIIETLSSMHKIVRELLDELYQEDLDEYLDIFGAEDYIEMIDTTGNKKIQGKVKEPVKKIGVREKKINSDGKKIINFDEDETVIELDGDYEVLGDAEPDPKRQKSKNKHDFIIQRIKKNGKKVKIGRASCREREKRKNEEG